MSLGTRLLPARPLKVGDLAEKGPTGVTAAPVQERPGRSRGSRADLGHSTDRPAAIIVLSWPPQDLGPALAPGHPQGVAREDAP